MTWKNQPYQEGTMTPPDSGEREVRCEATWMRRCIKPRDHHGPHDHRPVDEQEAALIPLLLAQRILAALEKGDATHELVEELRARLPG